LKNSFSFIPVDGPSFLMMNGFYQPKKHILLFK